eukprot:1882714-Pleurochrysis_carterae.AAC.1
MDAEAVVPGKLYFVDIPEFEDELRVGLGRAEEELSADGTRRVTCLQRRVWSNISSGEGFSWQEISIFKAARCSNNSRSVHESYEPIASFMPVMPELTSSWASHDPTLPLSHKKQKIKLTKKSVMQLFEFVRLRRPELLRSPADAALPATGSAQQQPLVATEAPEAAPTRPCPAGRRRQQLVTDSSSSDDAESGDSSIHEEAHERGECAVREEAEQGIEDEDAGPSGISAITPAVATAAASTSRPRRVRQRVERFA